MNTTVKSLLSLLIVSAVSLGLLWGSDLLTHDVLENQRTAAVTETFGELFPDAVRYEELTVSESITAAYRALNAKGEPLGYAVTVVTRGYVGDIEVHTALSSAADRVVGIRIGKHQETAGYGARITNTLFTDQFADKTPPLSLLGSDTGSLRNGTWRAESTEPDNSGFRDFVEITVQDGSITAVNWDAANEDGATKKALSKAGQYKMSETGLEWYQQAEIMEQALLQTQNPAAIVYDQQTGKTDAYTGATVVVSPFITLSARALESAGAPAAKSTSSIDGISGATVSSKAVIAAVNRAVSFIKEGVL